MKHPCIVVNTFKYLQVEMKHEQEINIVIIMLVCIIYFIILYSICIL